MLTAIEIWYNNFVKGGESVRDHDASRNRWLRCSRMVTALVDEKSFRKWNDFFLFVISHLDR